MPLLRMMVEVVVVLVVVSAKVYDEKSGFYGVRNHHKTQASACGVAGRQCPVCSRPVRLWSLHFIISF